jgi:GrpB protein
MRAASSALARMARSYDWSARLAFPDYLRTHPEVKVAYPQLKLSLAARFKHDRPAYTNAKSEFVEDVVRTALGGADEYEVRALCIELFGSTIDGRVEFERTRLRARSGYSMTVDRKRLPRARPTDGCRQHRHARSGTSCEFGRRESDRDTSSRMPGSPSFERREAWRGAGPSAFFGRPGEALQGSGAFAGVSSVARSGGNA